MKPGTLLQGKYRLLSLLGEGGMGAVWRADHLGLGAPVAVKLLHERGASSPSLRARFDAEAKTAANLRSPHVVQVFDFGIDEETQTPFLVMELLEGESLADRIERQGRLPPPEVARIVTHVARALTRAHELKIVHRDLKPANIFLVRNAEEELAKVLDFGIAKHARVSPHGSTATGSLLGTPHYMSAEQIRDSKNVDARTDLWSLAVIAVECLTGALPFDADTLPGLALRISTGEARLPSELGAVPAGVDQWFRRATAPDPRARFESAAQLAAELAQLCGVESALPRPELAETAADAASPEPGAAAARPRVQPSSVGPLSRTMPEPSSSRAGTRAVRGALAAAGLLLLGGVGLWFALPRANPSPSAAAPHEAAAALPAAPPAPEPEQAAPQREPDLPAPLAEPAPAAAAAGNATAAAAVKAPVAGEKRKPKRAAASKHAAKPSAGAAAASPAPAAEPASSRSGRDIP